MPAFDSFNTSSRPRNKTQDIVGSHITDKGIQAYDQSRVEIEKYQNGRQKCMSSILFVVFQCFFLFLISQRTLLHIITVYIEDGL